MRGIIENPVYMSHTKIEWKFSDKWVLVANCDYTSDDALIGGVPVAVADKVYEGHKDGFYDVFDVPKFGKKKSCDFTYATKRKKALKTFQRIMLVGACMYAVIIGVAIVADRMPYAVQVEFSGLELLMTGKDTFEILQTVNIRIDGYVERRSQRVEIGDGQGNIVDRYRVLRPVFNGRIEIVEYPFTFFGRQMGVHFFDDGGENSLFRNFSSGHVSYHSFDGWRMNSYRLGMIHTHYTFSSVAIHMWERGARNEFGSYSYTLGNRVIVAPVTDADSALEILHAKGAYWSENWRDENEGRLFFGR